VDVSGEKAKTSGDLRQHGAASCKVAAEAPAGAQRQQSCAATMRVALMCTEKMMQCSIEASHADAADAAAAERVRKQEL